MAVFSWDILEVLRGRILPAMQCLSGGSTTGFCKYPRNTGQVLKNQYGYSHHACRRTFRPSHYIDGNDTSVAEMFFLLMSRLYASKDPGKSVFVFAYRAFMKPGVSPMQMHPFPNVERARKKPCGP